MRVRCTICGDVRRSSRASCKCDREEEPEHNHWSKQGELNCDVCNP